MPIFPSLIFKNANRFYFSLLTVFLSFWAAVGWVQLGNTAYPIVSLASFFLTAIVSCGFLAIRLMRITKAYVEFLITYFFAFLLLPIIWLVLSHFGILGYGYVILKCCPSNQFLQNNLWNNFIQMRSGYMFDAMSHGIVFYASLILLLRHLNQPVYKWIAVTISSISFVLMMVMMYLAYFEVWS